MKSILDFKTHTINLHGKRTRQCRTAMPGNEVPGSEDIEKIMAYQNFFIGPLVWKCSTNDFELLLSKN